MAKIFQKILRKNSKKKQALQDSSLQEVDNYLGNINQEKRQMA